MALEPLIEQSYSFFTAAMPLFLSPDTPDPSAVVLGCASFLGGAGVSTEFSSVMMAAYSVQ